MKNTCDLKTIDINITRKKVSPSGEFELNHLFCDREQARYHYTAVTHCYSMRNGYMKVGVFINCPLNQTPLSSKCVTITLASVLIKFESFFSDISILSPVYHVKK